MPFLLPSLPTLSYRSYSWVRTGSPYRATAKLLPNSGWSYSNTSQSLGRHLLWFRYQVPAFHPLQKHMSWELGLQQKMLYGTVLETLGARHLLEEADHWRQVCTNTLVSSCLSLLPFSCEGRKFLCPAPLPSWCPGQAHEATLLETLSPNKFLLSRIWS